MATWEPYRDDENNGFRPMEFTATTLAIAKGVPVKLDYAGKILAPVTTFDNHMILGITAEAIAASGTGTVWTSGIFYSSAGGANAAQIGDPLTGAAATTVGIAASGKHTWGMCVITALTTAGAAYLKLISALDAGKDLLVSG